MRDSMYHDEPGRVRLPKRANAMVDFSEDTKTTLLKPGDTIYPGDVILFLDKRGEKATFGQYEVEVEDTISKYSVREFFLVSRKEVQEPRVFGTLVRNRDEEEFVFDGKEWRRENGNPTTWDAIIEKFPVEIVRKN